MILYEFRLEIIKINSIKTNGFYSEHNNRGGLINLSTSSQHHNKLLKAMTKHKNIQNHEIMETTFMKWKTKIWNFILSIGFTLMVYVSLELDDFGIDALNEHHVWNSANSAIVEFPLEFLRPEIWDLIWH